MATYDEIARDVSNWANRDTGVLDYDRIKQCLVFAHDEIYRTCRIAAIEGRFDYPTITQTEVETGALAIPTNAVEFIQLRKLFDGRGVNSASANRFTVAEARNDIRSFYGDATSRYSNYSYSRERDRLLIYPGLSENEEWQLYYYYRFEDPFERVELIEANIMNGLFVVDDTDVFSDTDDSLKTGIYETDLELVPHIYKTENADDIDDFIAAYAAIPANNFTVNVGDKIVGALEENWFRDANEKALLFGALHQAFDYLDETDQSGKFKAKFEQEIQKLNDEERRRQVLGGNVQTNFYSVLI